MLSEFSERVAETYSVEDVLPRMATLARRGHRRARRDRVAPRRRRAPAVRVVGRTERGRAPHPDADGELPAFADASKVAAVRHRDELLGALTVTKPPNDPLTAAEDKLVDDLAAQAGLVLRNVRLTEELRANLEELRASRQRLVTAQDGERRRIERNIHDGAQQQLVALAVQTRMAEGVAGTDPDASARAAPAAAGGPPATRSTTSAISRAASTRRCSPIRGSSPRSRPRRAGPPCR